jgi:hypothetical protein
MVYAVQQCLPISFTQDQRWFFASLGQCLLLRWLCGHRQSSSEVRRESFGGEGLNVCTHVSLWYWRGDVAVDAEIRIPNSDLTSSTERLDCRRNPASLLTPGGLDPVDCLPVLPVS